MLLRLCLLLASVFQSFTFASVVGVDYGTDWFKVSLIKPVSLLQNKKNTQLNQGRVPLLKPF
jgi:molecular chaperone DnaK (HSP70)